MHTEDALPTAPASPPRCANCEADLSGPWCPACGQRDLPLRQPITHLLAESFQELFGVDGRLWSSLKLLFLRPGALTVEHLAGRRTGRIRPLRLYLITSLLFFFLLALRDPMQQVSVDGADSLADTTLAASQLLPLAELLLERGNTTPETRSPEHEAAWKRDSRRARQYFTGSSPHVRWIHAQLTGAAPDSMFRVSALREASELLLNDASDLDLDLEVDLPAWWPESGAVKQLREARTRTEKLAAIEYFLREALRRLPTVMFLLLPLFAALLKLLYLRRGWYYSEHLIFGLHTHAVAFGIFALMLALGRLLPDSTGVDILLLLLALAIPVHFLLSQKRVYAQGWPRTVAKSLGLGAVYGFLLLWGIVLSLLVAASL